MSNPTFKVRLSEAELVESVREATLRERGVMMSFHIMLLGAMFIMMFIIVQWLVGQHIAMTMDPPLSSDHARARMVAITISSIFVSGLSIFSLTMMSKTPLTYLIFGAKVVDEKTLGEISRGQAALRCIIKTLAVVVTPVALFYLIKSRQANMVDSFTKTRVIVVEKRLVKKIPSE